MIQIFSTNQAHQMHIIDNRIPTRMSNYCEFKGKKSLFRCLKVGIKTKKRPIYPSGNLPYEYEQE